MGLGDWLGIYGAALATCLAAIQFVQWRQSRQFLSVSFIHIFDKGEEFIELSIANRGNNPVQLDFVAAGYCARYFKRPFSITCLNLRSMDPARDIDRRELKYPNSFDGKILSPGDLVRANISKTEVLALNDTHQNDGIFGISGYFAKRPCVWVEHSQSNQEICKVIKWTD